MLSYYVSLAYSNRPAQVGDAAHVTMLTGLYNEGIWGAKDRSGPADETALKASVAAATSDLVWLDVEKWTIEAKNANDYPEPDQTRIDQFKQALAWCREAAPNKRFGVYGPELPAAWQNFAYPWMLDQVEEYFNAIWRDGFDRIKEGDYYPLVPGGVWGASDFLCPELYFHGTEKTLRDVETWVGSVLDFCLQFRKQVIPFFDISKITDADYPKLERAVETAHARKCVPLLWGGWDDKTGAMTFSDDLPWLRLLKRGGPKMKYVPAYSK